MRKQVLLMAILMWAPIAVAQDPDIEANERAAMEDFFRTSEQTGETPVNARQRRGHAKRVSVPTGAVRLGCVCMDDTYSPARSIGACSGHGGVRYWLYQTREGDTTRVLTARHEFHPHPLDNAERSALAPPDAGNARKGAGTAAAAATTTIIVVQPMAYTTPGAAVPEAGTDWPEVAGLTAGSVILLLTLRLLLGWTDKHMPYFSDALHYLLRSRRRPPSR